ncbi:MAG: hypothetical protein Q9M31_04355, partial [Mariprofundus sp.]|nr:hypothetical protein [Mariprofundus sp.]
GWMSGNPTLSPFLRWNEVHGGSMEQTTARVGPKWGRRSPLTGFAIGSKACADFLFGIKAWKAMHSLFSVVVYATQMQDKKTSRIG